MLTREVLASLELIAFDFDGVFTDNMVYVSQDGVESVRCWRSDGLGLSRITALKVPVVVVSTEVNPVVSARCRKLKLACRQGVSDKAEAMLSICAEAGADPKRTMFVGNDVNDISAFKTVGVPVAVADAYPEVFQHVVYRTLARGGHGAVREICDLVFHARGGGLDE